METRALVDWVAEEGLDTPVRSVDDWTAGDEPDFTVRQRRRRITHAAPAAPAAPVEPAAAPALLPAADAPSERRTVPITGRPEALRPAPRLREVEQRRRPSRGPAERAASRPDRIAMWAVAMGFVLIVIASLSS